MSSFRKLGLFEREAKSPALNVKQLALLLCGLDPELKKEEIPQEQEDDYNIYYRHISKWVKSSGLFYGSSAVEQNADYMFALAYPLIDEEMTPQPIQDRCLVAIANIAARQKGKETLKQLGGVELERKGAELNKNMRGMHRKEDEEINTYKLLGLVISLLGHKVKNSYFDGKKITVSTIRNDIQKHATELKVPSAGLSKATLDKKIGNALKIIEIEANSE
ncbi:hypothetical protein E5C31_21620 [Providencia rettgeri]|nr:hypothetical protein [Providencia rettgeri]